MDSVGSSRLLAQTTRNPLVRVSQGFYPVFTGGEFEPMIDGGKVRQAFFSRVG
jgi:hypothetical protein